MRIAMISTPFVAVPPRDYGGIELVVYDLVEGLLDRGHEVTLLAPGDSHTRAPLRSLYARAQWPPEGITDLNHCSWALHEVAEGGFDVIHAHSATALALGRLVPVTPLVYTVHHAREPAFSEYYRHFSGVAFVAISEDQARRETGARPVTVIHHGLDPARYRWTERPGSYVCFIGRLAREKGPHAAIDAASLAGVPTRVAGEAHPPDHEYASTLVEPRLGAPHVTCLGCIGLKQKVPLLRDARALLMPIDWNEPFGRGQAGRRAGGQAGRRAGGRSAGRDNPGALPPGVVALSVAKGSCPDACPLRCDQGDGLRSSRAVELPACPPALHRRSLGRCGAESSA